VKRLRHRARTRAFNILDRRATERPNLDGFWFVLEPTSDPAAWIKLRTVFVCSMGDLFHEAVPGTFIHRVWMQMALCRDHTFIVLTKRPDRMAELVPMLNSYEHGTPQNIWLGVTAENQQRADERIPLLLQCPAVVRFVSVEPMLGPINFHVPSVPDGSGAGRNSLVVDDPYTKERHLDWVIVGGETGPGARVMDPDWARQVRDQCKAAGVPFFFKQMSNKAPIPDDLMIRQWPEVK